MSQTKVKSGLISDQSITASKLDVTGNGTSGQVLLSDGDGSFSWGDVSVDVNGVGTTNYISKWLDSDTITNSVIYDNGTNVGIGTDSPARKFVVNTNTQSISTFKTSNASRGYITFADANTTDEIEVGIGANANDLVLLAGDASERMRILSNGNVGIGTSSPSKRFHVNSGNTNDVALFESTDSFANIYLKDNSGEMTLQKVGTDVLFVTENSSTHGNLRFLSNSGTERMRINSNGNVGINTNSPSEKLDILVGNIKVSGGGIINPQIKFADGGGIKYSIGLFDSGDTFRIGTNDFASSFLTINSSGNVGIGTISPSHRLHIKSGLTNVTSTFESGDSVAYINVKDSESGTYGALFGAIGDNIIFANGSSAAERMRIDSLGRVGIGTSSPIHRLDVNGTIRASSSLILQSANYMQVEVDQIDSASISMGISSGTTRGFVNITNGEAGHLTSSPYFSVLINVAEKARFEEDGDLHVDGDVIAYSTTVSDERLKDNIVTIDNALDKVCELRGVEYDWNASSRSGQHDMGVIAQEVEKVFPFIVREKEMPLVDGNTYKTVDYEKLVGVLIEAVKELKAEVELLKSK